MNAPSTASKGPKAPDTSSKPIEIVQSQYATLYTNLHPILLLSGVALSFKSLVSDPVTTLTGLAPTVVILQSLYCIVCLPSTGQPAPPIAKAGAKRKSPKATQDVGSKIVPVFLSLVLTFTLSAPLIFIIVVLFGAPLTTHHAHTLLLALHLALLTTPQLFYAHGLDTTAWLRLISLQQPVDELYGLSLGACVGSWLGAIPIPLDWDREWQKWPVTIIVGMYIGAVVGKTLGGLVFKGAKMKIS